MKKLSTRCRYYFVDEAGDTTIFGRHGKVLIDEQGCSRYFILGVLDIPNRVLLQDELKALRKPFLRRFQRGSQRGGAVLFPTFRKVNFVAFNLVQQVLEQYPYHVVIQIIWVVAIS